MQWDKWDYRMNKYLLCICNACIYVYAPKKMGFTHTASFSRMYFIEMSCPHVPFSPSPNEPNANFRLLINYVMHILVLFLCLFLLQMN